MNAGVNRKSLIKDLTGKKFNSLTVINITNKRRSGSGGVIWTCRCDCGNILDCRSDALITGNTKSCGCRKRNRTYWYRKPEGISAFNSLFLHYRIGAESRKLKFEITKEIFADLIKQPCYYCGKELSNYSHPKNANGGIYYNGLDRIDNNDGYSSKNCVPCCKLCNFMKKNLSVKDFITHIRTINNYTLK